MEIGSQVGSYRIDALLGRGGMAEVYQVWHTGLHRYEALKVLPTEMIWDTSFVDRFLQEARLAAGLEHENIVSIHAVSSDSEPVKYFAMELIEGGDLADLIERQATFTVDETVAIVRQIGAALDHAHSYGIVHRDVKPANVLLRQKNDTLWSVKMVDFGIARAQMAEGAARLTRTGMIVGTPEYMSPEQGGSGAPVDHRSDIYSLGVIAYEMLCGRPPFRAEQDTSALSVIVNHINTPPTPPLQLNPSLPAYVNAALLKALSKHPDDRFADCLGFVEALMGARAVQGPRKPATVMYAPLPAANRRLPWIPVAVASAVLCGGVAVAICLGIHPPPQPPTTPTTRRPDPLRPPPTPRCPPAEISRLTREAEIYNNSAGLALEKLQLENIRNHTHTPPTDPRRRDAKDKLRLALQDSERALQCEPMSYEASRQRELSLFYLGRYKEAKEDIKAALAKFPGDSDLETDLSSAEAMDRK